MHLICRSRISHARNPSPDRLSHHIAGQAGPHGPEEEFVIVEGVHSDIALLKGKGEYVRNSTKRVSRIPRHRPAVAKKGSAT